MNGNSRKADCLLPRTAENQLRLFGKKQHSGQIEIAIASGEVQILQQAQLFCVGIREVTVIPLFSKNPEQQLVQFVNARLCGQFIGMELAGILKKTAQFLFRIDTSLVRPGFQPDDAFPVKVGLVHSCRNGQGDNHISIFEKNVLRLHHKRAADMLAGGVADQLVRIMQFSRCYAGQCSIILHADKNYAAVGIGEGGHFRSQRIRIVDSGLELACAVLACGGLFPERLKCECHACSLQYYLFPHYVYTIIGTAAKSYRWPERMSAAALLAAAKVSGRNWAYFFLVKSTFLCVSISEIMSMLNLPLLARLTAK